MILNLLLHHADGLALVRPHLADVPPLERAVDFEHDLQVHVLSKARVACCFCVLYIYIIYIYVCIHVLLCDVIAYL